MDRPNLGFACFLVLLLIAPGIPVPGFAADVNLSPAVAGLVIWLMLAPRLPVRAVLGMPTVLALIGLSVYMVLVSLLSGRFVSIAYAAQYACYALLAGILIAAYLVDRVRKGRQEEAWRILAWVGAIYLIGIIVSLWTGPIYPHQVGMFVKHYGSISIVRGVGFAGSANAAGGTAAVLAAFYLFLYRPAGRPSLPLALLGVAGLSATLSRSAIVAFAAATCLLVVLLALRALLVWGTVRMRLPMLPAVLLAIGLVAVPASFQQPIIGAAWERLALNEEVVDRDVNKRIDLWESGTQRWAGKPIIDRIFGSGFRSAGVNESRGTFHGAHNAYIEILNDFGFLGLTMFVWIVAFAFARALYALLMKSNDLPAMFCVVGLTTVAVHNVTQVFFYSVVTLVLLIVLLTCGELLKQGQPLRAPQAKGPARTPALRTGERATPSGLQVGSGATPLSRARSWSK